MTLNQVRAILLPWHLRFYFQNQSQLKRLHPVQNQRYQQRGWNLQVERFLIHSLLSKGNLPKFESLISVNKTGLGYFLIEVSKLHTSNNLTILIHFKPHLNHCYISWSLIWFPETDILNQGSPRPLSKEGSIIKVIIYILQAICMNSKLFEKL